MELSTVIVGPIVTEKAERLKAGNARTYTLRIAHGATKIDVRNALNTHFGVEVKSVRIVRVQPKSRLVGMGAEMMKRKTFKKALVTLTTDSKPLDIAAFETISA